MKYLLLFAVLFLLVGCSSSETDMATAVIQTVEAMGAELPEAADTPESPRATAALESTNTPNPLPEATPEVDTSRMIAANFPSGSTVYTKEEWPARFDVARVLIGDCEYVLDYFNEDVLEKYRESAKVCGYVLVRVTNDGDETIQLHHGQASIQVGSEQVDLDSDNSVSINDSFDDIHPGATKVGGVWFPVSRSEIGEIYEIIYRNVIYIDGSSWGDSDVEIRVSLNDRVFEPKLEIDSYYEYYTSQSGEAEIIPITQAENSERSAVMYCTECKEVGMKINVWKFHPTKV